MSEPHSEAADTSAAADGAATTTLLSLPHAVIVHIFSLLPVDVRLRCAEVCRGWRAVLAARSAWTRLELTAASGVLVRRRNVVDALLRCAAARAGGGLQSLRIDASLFNHPALLQVAAANAGALRELRACEAQPHSGFSLDEARALLRAAPLLEALGVNLGCNHTTVDAARAALRNEAPFGPLRVRTLRADLSAATPAAVAALAADAATHASLRGLTLSEAPLRSAAALDAVVDAALARRLERVSLYSCRLAPAAAPALARLLRSDALTELHCGGDQPFLDAPAVALLAPALRGNATLTSLTLCNANVFANARTGAALLGALTGHARLRVLRLGGNRVAPAHRAAAGGALGALLAANAAALTCLDVTLCVLGDVGLRPLLEALPRNAHLRELNCAHNGASADFAADVALPAVRANSSLRRTDTPFLGGAADELERELARELARRVAADAAAAAAAQAGCDA
jgi:hypothetical protein